MTLKELKIRAEKQSEERRHTVKKFVKIRGIRGKKTKLRATPLTPPNSALKTFEQSEKKNINISEQSEEPTATH
jgi:hypothetical protein